MAACTPSTRRRSSAGVRLDVDALNARVKSGSGCSPPGLRRDERAPRPFAANRRVPRRTDELPRSGITGAELDDLALQAADDATLAVLAKLPTFRGESRFTTWAFKFVILEVSVKVNRHPWRRKELRLEEDAWELLPSFLGFGPEESVAGKELVDRHPLRAG